MYSFSEIEISQLNDKNFEQYEGDIYNSISWLKVIKEADNITPLVIQIKEDDKLIGYFTGGLFKKIGIKIIGSPFKGWTTPYMGFLTEDNYPIENIIKPLWEYLKKKYKCVYAEISDKKFKLENLKSNNLKYISTTTYTINMDKPIEEVFKGFSAHRRQHIKHFEKYGGGIEMITPDKQFISEFYKMTIDVFSVQGLKPSYSKDKVEKIIEILPLEYIYCAKAYNPEKKCIGMSMVFGYGKNCQTFMIVTDHKEKYDQNSALFWDAMQYWHKRGAIYCDLLGKRPYKEGFRPDEPTYYRVILTKFKILFLFRNIAKRMYWVFNKISYNFSKKRRK